MATVTAKKMTNNIVVLYHADCPDGLGAAWVAWKKFGAYAKYIPVRHQAPPPENLTGKRVYMLDFSYPEHVMRKLLATAASVTVIDHHISNEASAKMTQDHLFSLEHSGAALAWMYFYPDKKMPKLLAHIEDKDMWWFRMPHTKELVELIESHPFEFPAFDKLVKGCERKETLKRYVLEGAAITHFMEREVAKTVGNAEEIMFEGHACLMANSSSNTSYVGAALVKKLPPIALIWSRRGGRIIVSLRSDGTVNVANIAKKYGGGGNTAAAAFALEADNPLTKIIKE